MREEREKSERAEVESRRKWRELNRVCTPLLSRGAPPLFSAHFPRLFLSPAPLRASPRSLSKGACPLDLGSAPHFGASVSSPGGELSQPPLPRGKGKRGGKPTRTVRCSSPRAIRPRSRTLSNAERPAAWPVEDGARSVVSGGDGGVVWWSSVVEWCLVQNNESKRKTTI